jgi:hypothetical protein
VQRLPRKRLRSPVDMRFPLLDENVTDFIAFLRESGGFVIW